MKSTFIISDFNIEPLTRYLMNQQDEVLSVETAPFGQVFQSLTSKEERVGGIVWTLPEKVVPTFSRAVEFAEVDVSRCLAEVAVFANAIHEFASYSQYVFVTSWVLPIDQRGYGILEWRSDIGLTNLLARMNLHLADLLSEASNIYMLDAARWLASAPQAQSPKMWYATKVPYSNVVFQKAAADIIAAIRALSGKSRKLIIVDLDNTLWGGVVGETGWQGIRLGGHDFIGEAFSDFQSRLRALSRRGIQLAIVSKNDEAVALKAIDQHSEMVLRRSDFAGWRINWNDKAENLASLVDELNLGLDSVVFIDDNVAERERIRSAFPQVLVPEWPIDPTAYSSALHELDCFDSAALSNEDRLRTEMYVAERGRRETLKSVSSKVDWMQQLETKLTVCEIDQSNISRVTQLFNKTNQLNLSTRRLTEKEIMDWSEKQSNQLLAVSVSDCYGDIGLVGVIGVEATSSQGEIVDFILSCRAMGRQVEQAMMYLAVNELVGLGATEVLARYLPTERNRPTLDILRSVGLEEKEEQLFVFDCANPFVKPDVIEINYAATKVDQT